MKNRARFSAAFLSVTTLFFLWGFISSNNDPLLALLRASFGLSMSDGMWTQLVFFAAYGVVSLPSAWLIGRLGALRLIFTALATMILGCLLVQLLVPLQNYPLILVALFVLGMGITMLQVAANPLAAALGPPEHSHFRLTFAQTFNSLGVVLGVNFGSILLLGPTGVHAGPAPALDAAGRAFALAAVNRAFGIIVAMLAVLMFFTWMVRHKIDAGARAHFGQERISFAAALRSRWAVAGALAIGLYVGAEVSIGSIMINFLSQSDVLGVSLETAGFYLANIYWMGALMGRILGSLLLTRMSAPKLLAGAATIAAALCLIVASTGGTIAAAAALSVGFFNSIMFPTIFTITLERSGVSQSSTSGLLCMAIIGGAIIPYAVGRFADASGLGLAFIIPALAYLAISFFAAAASRARADAQRDGDQTYVRQ